MAHRLLGQQHGASACLLSKEVKRPLIDHRTINVGGVDEMVGIDHVPRYRPPWSRPASAEWRQTQTEARTLIGVQVWNPLDEARDFAPRKSIHLTRHLPRDKEEHRQLREV